MAPDPIMIIFLGIVFKLIASLDPIIRLPSICILGKVFGFAPVAIMISFANTFFLLSSLVTFKLVSVSKIPVPTI